MNVADFTKDIFLGIFGKFSGQLFFKSSFQNQIDSRVYENLFHC